MLMRNRYSVRARTQTRDARGERLGTYTHKFYVWGETPRDGSTGQRNDGVLRTEDVLRFRTRYTEDIEIGDQLVHSTTPTLYVRSASDVDGSRRFLQIVASRSPSTGS